MTNEEAIKLLEHISIAYTPTDAYGDYDDPQPYEQAVDMAIEALSDEQKEEELAKDIARRMATIIENEQDMRVILKNASAEPTDLISREEAIKEIENRIGLAWTESEANYNQGMEMALSIIEALPSVSAEKLQLSEETSTMGVDISTNTPTDLISRAEVLALAEKGYIISNSNYKKVCDLINELPSADRPSGEWIMQNEELKISDYRCSVCGHYQDDKTDYCPNCGADMRGEKDD